MDCTGRIVYANAAVCKALGYDREDVIGRYAWEFMGSEDETARLRETLQFIHANHPTPQPYVAQACRKDGTSVGVEVTWDYRKNAQGEIIGTISVLSDIRDRKAAEERLQLSNTRLKILREISHNILVAETPEGLAKSALIDVRRLLACCRASIVEFSARDGSGRVLATDAEGTTQVGTGSQINPDEFPSLDALMRGETVIATDLQKLSKSSQLIRAIFNEGIQSVLIAPFVYKKETFGALCVGTDHTRTFGPEDKEVAQEVAELLGVALRSSRLHEEVSQGRRRLRQLSRELMDVQEKERRHFARELHDEIGQTLTAIKICLDNCARSSGHDHDEELGKAREFTGELLGRVGHLSLDLRPPVLDDLGLLPTLLWHFQRYQQQHRIEVSFRHEGLRDRRFGSQTETTVYRVVQEALNNSAYHANVDHVGVLILTTEATLIARILDEGDGFDLPSVLNQSPVGLTGMYERAHLAEGRLDIRSEPGKGTYVVLQIPLATRNQKNKKPDITG